VPSRCRFCAMVQNAPRYYVDQADVVVVEDARFRGPVLVTRIHGVLQTREGIFRYHETLRSVCDKMFPDGRYYFNMAVSRGHLVINGRRAVPLAVVEIRAAGGGE